MQRLCTATLIAPRLILTAKHCALEKFVQQPEAGPAQVVETCNVADTGFMGLGCDVSVYHLKESIDVVRPIPVATSSVGESAIGKPLSAVGYGKQEQQGMVYGTRKAGTLTMRSVRGAPMQTLFPSVDGFLDAMREASARSTRSSGRRRRAHHARAEGSV